MSLNGPDMVATGDGFVSSVGGGLRSFSVLPVCFACRLGTDTPTVGVVVRAFVVPGGSLLVSKTDIIAETLGGVALSDCIVLSV